jgi:hypothetical protein
MQSYQLLFPISTSPSVASPSSSHSLPFSLLPIQSPAAVAALATRNQPSNHLSVKLGSNGAPKASPILLFISSGRLLLRSSAELMTYVAAICEMMSAKLVLAWWRTPGTTRANRKKVCSTLLKDSRSMTPESKKEIVRLHATRSIVGSQCFASSARKLLIGSLLEKLAFGEEKRRSVVTVVAEMRYAQYIAKTVENMLTTRPNAV